MELTSTASKLLREYAQDDIYFFAGFFSES
jgi:hypothetical protein